MANARARKLRREMTDSERKLWSALRRRQMGGSRFRRQHPLGPYIVDFVCLEKRFVIEIDGGHHNEPAHTAHDARRTRWLEEQGFVVLRVWNTDVRDNLDGVVDAISAELRLRSSFERTRRAGSARASPHLGAPG